ncbi:MAG: protein-disulfide reductase DsbD family protein [Oceanidesulfovibrio sp.]
MKKYSILAIIVFWVCCMALPGVAAGQLRAPVQAHWELYSYQDRGLLGVLVVTPEEGSYIYGHEQGPTGLPTTLAVNTFPAGLDGDVVYPAGDMKPDSFDPDLIVPVYDSTTRLFVPLRRPAAGGALTLAGSLEGLACTDTACFPLKLMVESAFEDVSAVSAAMEQPWWDQAEPLLGGVEPPAESARTEPAPTRPEQPEMQAADEAAMGQEQAQPAAWDFSPRFLEPHLEVASLAKALLLAIIAGLILNVMPCVLPVVSLKLSSIVAVSSMDSQSDRRRFFREHNIFFAAGILTYFIVLGAVLGSLGMAWGALFQSQGLVLTLALVVFALGLSLFGVYDLPIVDLKTGRHVEQNPRSQAFFTGLMATLLATPCSGPFLGGVLGWVLSQSPTRIVLVFLAIGFGMSLPYLLLTVWPQLVRYFPKPGRWNVHLERIVGFFLMGTTIYLLSILSEELQTRGLVTLLVTGVGAWIWGQWTSLSDAPRRRLAIQALAVAVVVGGLVWSLAPRQDIQWPELELHEFREDLGEQAMMLDFTADWCPNCKALEATVLTDANVAAWQEEYGLRFYKVDLTLREPWEMELLESLGSKSIPVVAVIPAGAGVRTPLVLRDIFTTSQLEEALEETFGE